MNGKLVQIFINIATAEAVKIIKLSKNIKKLVGMSS
jgi:hypothetical protein